MRCDKNVDANRVFSWFDSTYLQQYIMVIVHSQITRIPLETDFAQASTITSALGGAVPDDKENLFKSTPNFFAVTSRPFF